MKGNGVESFEREWNGLLEIWNFFPFILHVLWTCYFLVLDCNLSIIIHKGEAHVWCRQKKCYCVELLISQITHLNYPHLSIIATGKFVNYLTHSTIINCSTPLIKLVFISLNLRKPKTFLSNQRKSSLHFSFPYSSLPISHLKPCW